MKYSKAFAVFVIFLSVGPAVAQHGSLAENAALRYWAAFSQIQDSGITDQEARELNSVLEDMRPYDLSKYKDLVEKNAPALEIMTRATSLPNCDWGLDYGLGEDLPVEYARKALVLGRLNVLHVIFLYHSGNKDGAIRALAAGLRFAHDVGNGGSLFATLVAKDLLVTHLLAIGDGFHMGQLSAQEKSQLQNAVLALGDGLDWSAAAKRDLDALREHYTGDSPSSAALARIGPLYSGFVNDASKLPALTEAIDGAPQRLRTSIPNPQRVLEQKQELTDRLAETRSLMR